MRICGDYKMTVNQASKTESYPLSKIDDLLASLAVGKKFSKLDLANAYQQVPLDKSKKASGYQYAQRFEVNSDDTSTTMSDDVLDDVLSPLQVSHRSHVAVIHKEIDTLQSISKLKGEEMW